MRGGDDALQPCSHSFAVIKLCLNDSWIILPLTWSRVLWIILDIIGAPMYSLFSLILIATLKWIQSGRGIWSAHKYFWNIFKYFEPSSTVQTGLRADILQHFIQHSTISNLHRILVNHYAFMVNDMTGVSIGLFLLPDTWVERRGRSKVCCHLFNFNLSWLHVHIYQHSVGIDANMISLGRECLWLRPCFSNEEIQLDPSHSPLLPQPHCLFQFWLTVCNWNYFWGLRTLHSLPAV